MNPRIPTFIKHSIRSLFDIVSRYTGFLSMYERRMRRFHTILMYHRVLPLKKTINYPLESLVIPISSFEEQMQWLSRRCTVLPVSEAIAVSSSRSVHEKPIVSVTFDDGYFDNYLYAAPLLEKYGIRGTFYITTEFVSSGSALWYDRAAAGWNALQTPDRHKIYRSIAGNVYGDSDFSKWPLIREWMETLKRCDPIMRHLILEKVEALAEYPIDLSLYSPMSIVQMKELSENGHEIGSHTETHPIMIQLDDDKLNTEIRASKNKIEKWIGNKIESFCYPNGDYDTRVVKAVSNAGFSNACTVDEGRNCILRDSDSMQLKRIPVTMRRTHTLNTHSLTGFRSEISCLHDILR